MSARDEERVKELVRFLSDKGDYEVHPDPQFVVPVIPLIRKIADIFEMDDVQLGWWFNERQEERQSEMRLLREDQLGRPE